MIGAIDVSQLLTIAIEEARTGVTAYMDWLGIHGDVILFLTRQDDAR